MNEIVINLHLHTRYSDGSGSHAEIARSALESGLDAVIVTDHNVLVQGLDGYLRDGSRRVLVLVGEEVHDRSRISQQNHLLVIGSKQETASVADNTTVLIKNIRRAGGLTFLAHIVDPSAPAFQEPDISWDDWSVQDYTGIELWNGFSELKKWIPTKLHGIFLAYLPAFIARGPHPGALQRWDALLAGKRVVAIGGSDAHALHVRLGPLRRVVYPYGLHFKTINTHVLLPESLSGIPAKDAQVILDAVAAGHCFIGYDLPSSTYGFRFTAYGVDAQVVMGDEINVHSGITLHAWVPSFAEIRLVKDGEVIHVARRAQAINYHTSEPGVYRIEVYRQYLARRRGWIFSNPIYAR